MNIRAFLLFCSILLPSVSLAQNQWKGDNGFLGDTWGNTDAWTAEVVPNSVGAIARFGNTGSGHTDVGVIFGSYTVGTIEFLPSAQDHNIWSFGGTLRMNASSGNALINVRGGDQTVSPSLVLDDTTEIRIDSGSGVSLELAGVISGSGGLTKTSAGSLLISGTGANTYSGTTTVSAGTMTLQKSDNVTAISGPINISGGTLLLGANEQIGNASAMTLSGGTLGATGGGSIAEAIGTLTLTANSVINMALADLSLSFASLGGSSSITIQNWGGSTSGGGADQVIFNSTLTSGQLSQISFSGYAGVPAIQLAGGEVVPNVVPEMGTELAGMFLLFACVFHATSRRKFRPLDPAH